MQIYSTFDHSIQLELAITQIEKLGVTTIFAVPLDKGTGDILLFDTMHQSDGMSFINKGLFLAVIFSVIGASRGFILELGPIFWGIIGGCFGFSLGFIIDLIINFSRRKKKRYSKKYRTEVILIIECSEDIAKQVEKILWSCSAFGVAKIRTSEVEAAVDSV